MKNLLSLAVAASAAGVAGVSTAQMYINSEGTGEALVFRFIRLKTATIPPYIL